MEIYDEYKKALEEIEDLRKKYLEAIDNYEQERYKNNKAIEFIENNKEMYEIKANPNPTNTLIYTIKIDSWKENLLEILKR